MRSQPLPEQSERTYPRALFASLPWRHVPELEHLAVAGDLCLWTAPELEEVIAAIRKDATVVVLDLTAVAFADSSGIHAILNAEAGLRAEERRLVVVPGPPWIRRLFELSGVAERLEFARNGSGPSPVA